MFKLTNYYDDDEAIGTGGDKELGKEEVIKLLGEDDKDDKDEVLDLKDKKDDKEEKDKKDSKDDKEEDEVEEPEDKEDKEGDELKDLEDELEEVDEEKLELMAPVRRKDILGKYPKLFKDFPYLERAYYREQQFTELLPTIDDAKEAVEKAEIFDKFSNDLGQGDLAKALAAVKSHGETAFNKLVDDYLPNLAKVDKEAYHHIIGNVTRTIVLSMIDAAGESKDEDLKVAAGILNKFMFQTDKIVNPSLLSKPKSDQADPNEELNTRLAQLHQEKFEESRDSINTKVSNVLKATIEGNIDPKQSMTDYVRRNAARDCQERLEAALESDKRLNIIIDKLWKQASNEKFSKTSIDRIKSAYLSGARSLLPAVLKQARNEALKGSGKRVKDDDDNKEDSPSKKGPLPAGRSATTKSTGSNTGKSDREKAAAIPKGMSTRDYLMQD